MNLAVRVQGSDPVPLQGRAGVVPFVPNERNKRVYVGRRRSCWHVKTVVGSSIPNPHQLPP